MEYILAIDPETITGYAIFEINGEFAKLVEYGTFKLNSNNGKGILKALHIRTLLDGLSNRFTISRVVGEDVVLVRNFESAVDLIKLQTVVELYCLEKGMHYHYKGYAPRSWRGRANGVGILVPKEKGSITQKDWHLLMKGQLGTTINDNEADAIGIGMVFLKREYGVDFDRILLS